MVLANLPVVWFGERLTRMLPIRTVRIVSALIFGALGLFALVGGT